MVPVTALLAVGIPGLFVIVVMTLPSPVFW